MGKWIGSGIWLFLGATSLLGSVLMCYKEIRLRTLGEIILAPVVSITPSNSNLVYMITLNEKVAVKVIASADKPLKTTPCETPSKLGCVEVISDRVRYPRSKISEFFYHEPYELVQRRTRLVDIIARTALLGIAGLAAIAAGISFAMKNHNTI